MAKSLGFLSLLLVLALGCGPDRAMLMETKFDGSLRQKVSSIGKDDPSQMLRVIGKCTATIDALMRQDLINAGADVLSMKGDVFTVNVSSEDVFTVAGLDFVTQLELSEVK